MIINYAKVSADGIIWTIVSGGLRKVNACRTKALPFLLADKKNVGMSLIPFGSGMCRSSMTKQKDGKFENYLPRVIGI